MQVVLAVKTLDIAKSRLAPVFGARERAELVLAMAADTMTAVMRCAVVGSVLVVSRDPDVCALARDLGAATVDDPTSTLNAALRHGARQLDPGRAVAVLPADLPALRPDTLRAAVEAAGGVRAAVADRAGTGTVLLLAPPGTRLDPRFGPGSAAAHEGSGALMLDGEWPGLRTDVDTSVDLAAAVALGVSARTAAHLAASPSWSHPDAR